MQVNNIGFPITIILYNNKISANMIFKIGFFYNLTHSSSHDNRLLVVFDDNHISFKLFDSLLIPRKLNLYNLGYYDFSMPVIYREDDKGDIVELLFFRDIPVYSDLSRRDGFYIFSPSIEWGNVPEYSCDLNLLSDVDVLYNGQSVIDGNIIGAKIQSSIFKIVVQFYLVRNRVLLLRRESEPMTLMEPYLEQINEIKSYIDSVNISEIISDLHVSVEDFLRTKLGDDNTYYIYRTASVSNPLASEDQYISKIIGIGRTCIYKDCGYTNKLELYSSDFIKEHPLGVYFGEILENEKKRILSKYSKEEHMGFLLADRFIERERRRGYELPKLERILKKIIEILFVKFKLSVISNEDREFEKRMYKLTNRYNDAKKELETINNSIKNATTFNE